MVSEPEAIALRRQHPLSWIFLAFTVIRSAVIPAAIFLVFSQGIAFGWLAGLLVLPAIALGVAHHLSLKYAAREEELVVRDGILRRRERHIRYSRIHNLDEIQSLLHRWVGAVAVKIETASGGKPEAVLHLSTAAAAQLRSSIFESRGSGASDVDETGPEATPLVRVPAADLVRLGLIQNRGIVVFAAAVGVLSQGWSDLGTEQWQRLAAWILGLMESDLDILGLSATAWVAVALLMALASYLFLALLSIVLAFVRFFGFTLRRGGDDLVARYGLLSRVQVTVPRRRIHDSGCARASCTACSVGSRCSSTPRAAASPGRRARAPGRVAEQRTADSGWLPSPSVLFSRHWWPSPCPPPAWSR